MNLFNWDWVFKGTSLTGLNIRCFDSTFFGFQISHVWGLSKTAHTLTVSTRSGFNSAARKFSSHTKFPQ